MTDADTQLWEEAEREAERYGFRLRATRVYRADGRICVSLTVAARLAGDSAIARYVRDGHLDLPPGAVRRGPRVLVPLAWIPVARAEFGAAKAAVADEAEAKRRATRRQRQAEPKPPPSGWTLHERPLGAGRGFTLRQDNDGPSVVVHAVGAIDVRGCGVSDADDVAEALRWAAAEARRREYGP